MRGRNLVLIIFMAMLMGCSKSPTLSSTAIPSDTPQTNGYPAPTSGNGYPYPNQEPSNLPGYPVATTLLATMVPTSTPDAAKTPIIIANVVHTADGLEVIAVKNISQTDQDISLFSLLNPDTQEIYPFPEDYKLAAGEAIYVYNGTGAAYPGGKKWLDKPFLNVEGATVQLLNQAARIMYTFTYYP